MKDVFLNKTGTWIKLGIPILVILISAIIGFFPDTLKIYLAIGSIAVLTGISLGKDPGIGFALLIIASQVIPWGLGTGTNSEINVAMIIIIALTIMWLIKMIFRIEKFEIFPSKTIPPILIFIFIVVLAFLNGQIQWFSVSPAPIRAQIGGAALFLLSFFAFLTTAHQLKNFFWLKVMVWLLVFFCLIYMIG